MKFDTVIIGGGLSGLAAGIELARRQRRVAIISAGQSSLHFSSGSFELLGYDAEGKPVTSPLDTIGDLATTHPYRRMGDQALRRHLAQVRPLFENAGIEVHGDDNRNHWRLSPTGVFKPAWLTMNDYVRIDDPNNLPWKKLLIVNLRGFLDFFPRFIAASLEPRGVETQMVTVAVKALDDQRVSSTEMRATNIARVLHGDAVNQLADEVNRIGGDAEAVMLPAVAGFDDFEAARRLRELINRTVVFAPTMGASVPGVRAQIMLQRHFRRLGGTYMLGDTVVKGFYGDDHSLKAVRTVNFSDDHLEADNFIFAAGSFFSHGLTATPEGVSESVLGLDVIAAPNRSEWFAKDIFRPQPYMKFGIATADGDFTALRGGHEVPNLRVAGASLAGIDSLREGSGAGIALLTALDAVEKITRN